MRSMRHTYINTRSYQTTSENVVGFFHSEWEFSYVKQWVHVISARFISLASAGNRYKHTHSLVFLQHTHIWVVSAWRCRCTIKHAIICFVTFFFVSFCFFHSCIHLGLAQNKHISTIFIWFIIHFICSFIAFYDYVLWLLCICLRAIAFDNASSVHLIANEDHVLSFPTWKIAKHSMHATKRLKWVDGEAKNAGFRTLYRGY